MKMKKMAAVTCLLGVAIMAVACSKGSDKTVEEEVAQVLTESVLEDEGDAADGGNEDISTTEDGSADSQNDTTTTNDKKDTATKSNSAKGYGTNLFLGDTSTATSYNIKFTIETDSGVAGFTWGSKDGTKGEYYLVAFDCTRDFPKLYTCRKDGDATYDENYTNLDFMYPEMVMFTNGPHIIEIKVDGTSATVLLDSYTASTFTLDHAVTVGQIGTWVMEGDYHESIDDLFVAEGVEGDGDWIYSEDFAGKKNIFSPGLSTRGGKLYAEAGYHTVPKTELMR